MNVVVIGGGVGGLAAATRLAILGHRVQLFEARQEIGGLASGFHAAGFDFDGGPYILLDRPGLEWALERIGADVASLHLTPAEDLYEVRGATRPVRVFLDLQRTIDGLENAGRAYEQFVLRMDSIRTRLTPLLRVPHPNLWELARRGSLSIAPFLLRSLGSVLKGSGLPHEVIAAISIWTHIAGQPIDSAPSVMAFVPALIHRVGAFVPAGGMRSIPAFLEQNAVKHDVKIRKGLRVRRIVTKDNRVTGVELEGETIECDAVVSNYHGVGTYDELVEVPERVRRNLRALPLQSPGLCAYVTAAGDSGGPYLRFRLHERGARLRITPRAAGERFPLRLITPFGHRPENEQTAELERVLADRWWREGLTDVRIVGSRTVRGWGREMNLYRDSMNPAMTRRLMLHGRIAHRSPWIRGLYLAGASTHPGQWVSFCAISGVLAAELLDSDHAAGSIR